MKYRIFGSIFVVAVLVAVFMVLEPSNAPSQSSAPSSSGLRLN